MVVVAETFAIVGEAFYFWSRSPQEAAQGEADRLLPLGRVARQLPRLEPPEFST